SAGFGESPFHESSLARTTEPGSDGSGQVCVVGGFGAATQKVCLRKRRFVMFMKRVCIALSLLALLASSMFGQVASARLEGTVQDQTGAVIPSAKVTAINTKTQSRVD